jgi:NAD+ kinase
VIVKKVGVAANLEKPNSQAHLREFIRALIDNGFEVSLDRELQGVVDFDGRFGIDDKCDLIAALGGDGTILKVARTFVDLEIPILGINLGRLGFLAADIGTEGVKRIREDRFRVQERMRITASIIENGRTVKRLSALNDVVVHGVGYSRMIIIRSEVDSKLIREYTADGIILATPTGSTAYSLSAGGPLMMPTMQAIALTPLCSHALNIRPIILDADQKIVVRIVSSKARCVVTVDGQEGVELKSDQCVEIEKSRRVTKLVIPEDYDFFSLLRDKL